MRHLSCIGIMFVFAISSAASQGRGFGFGVILGDPTGISAKGWVSPRAAVDAGLAWSTRDAGYVHAHMDYLWHFKDVVNTSQQVLPYVGVGGRILGNRNTAIAGVRVAGGVAWLPAGAPLDVFLEIAPTVDLAPETELNVDGGIGIRFFFQ